VLCTADCPNAGVLIDFLARQADVQLTVTVVTEQLPVPSGFAGSPTVLVDWVNPFGTGRLEGVACALSPLTVAQLQEYLRHRAAPG
jgi:hypothetical protein